MACARSASIFRWPRTRAVRLFRDERFPEVACVAALALEPAFVLVTDVFLAAAAGFLLLVFFAVEEVSPDFCGLAFAAGSQAHARSSRAIPIVRTSRSFDASFIKRVNS